MTLERPELRRLIWKVVFLVAPALVAHAQDATSVLVVDRIGQVAITGAEAPQPVATLAALAVGTRIRLQSASRVTLLYIGSGDEYTVIGPGAARLDAAGVSTTEGASAQRRLASEAKMVKLRTDGIAMGGVVMRSSRLRARFPAGVLTTSPKSLTWESLATESRYTVELHDASGAVLFSRTVQGLSMPFPDEVPIKPDERYTWNVSLDGALPGPLASASFALASEPVRKQASEFNSDPGTPFADRLVFGLWLEQVGALGEARQLWRQLADERPDDEALVARARR